MDRCIRRRRAAHECRSQDRVLNLNIRKPYSCGSGGSSDHRHFFLKLKSSDELYIAGIGQPARISPEPGLPAR